MEEGQHDSVFCHVMGWQPRELSWSYYCYSWSFHINTAASVLFGLRLSHYAQSIFMLLFLSKLACQWGDLNSCLGCESQMGFKRGGEGWDAWHRQMVMSLSTRGSRASRFVVLCIYVQEGRRSNVWQCFERTEWWITWPEGAGAAARAAAWICLWWLLKRNQIKMLFVFDSFLQSLHLQHAVGTLEDCASVWTVQTSQRVTSTLT